MKYLNIVIALLPSLSIAKLGETHHDRRQQANAPLVQVGLLNPSFKLGRCEGDCDDDSDCNSSDLVCFPRTKAYEDVPGCSGGLNDPSKYDYCVRKSDLNGAPTQDPSPVLPAAGDLPLKFATDLPLALCEGDCDSNFDCESGLVCFQRKENEPVPGCLGGENDGSRTDYCIYPNGGSQPNPSPTPPPAPVGGSGSLTHSTNFPLSLCQGDCDANSDCRGDMVCFQRNVNDPVPGCVGGEDDGSRTDYCIASSAPAPSPTTTVVTSGDKELKWSTSFPLSECEGDCDYNDDCEDGLFCWQRGPGDDVPGCIGYDNSRVDYCIAKDKLPAKKLKMYWESSFFWQELKEERWWCLTCTECETLTTGDGWEGGCVTPVDDKCRDGHQVWIQRCRDTNQRFEIIKNSNSGDQIRVYGTDLCFSTIINRYLELKSCDRNMPNQLWDRITNLDKFELRPYSQRNLSMSVAKCLSQLHHPKATEVVALRSCRLNDDYDTNYWTEYYG